MPANDRNSDLIYTQAADLQTRNEANLALAYALPMFMMGGQMRYLYPFSSILNTGTAYDFSQQGRTAALSGAAPVYGYFGLTPVATFNGVNQSLLMTDAAALHPGAEATFFQWIRFNRLATLETYHHKGDLTAATNAYWFRKTAADAIEFLVSGTGAVGAAVAATSPVVAALNQWYFIAGRYTGGAEIAIWVNDPGDRNVLVKTTNVAGIPANMFNSGANVFFGRGGGPTQYCQCDLAFVGGYHAVLSDTVIQNWYNQSRALFGI